jgi:hypothetical protein
VLVVKNDSFDLKYLGQAIGIIPESNNAQFEDRLCEDNVTRTFLTVEGLIWTKWDEPVDILNRDLFKAQSMELHSDYEGVYNEEDNMFHFSKFKFFGACGLGKDVLPAMINSTIEVNFNLDMFKQEIQDKMEQFKLALSNNNDDRGGTKMNEKLELLGQFSQLGEEVLENVKKSLDSYSLEDLGNKLFQMSESTPREEEPVVFTLTSEQLEEELKRELYEIEAIQEQYYDETYSYPRYSLVDSMPEQSIVVAYDCKENILVGFGYQLINENVEIDAASAVRYKVEFVPMNLAGDPDIEMNDKFSKQFTSLSQVEHKVKLKEKELNKEFQVEKESAQEVLEKATSDFAKLQEDYTKLEDSAKELEQFKLSHVQKERENAETALFDSFSAELTDDEMSPIMEKKSEFSLEEIEEKLFALAGRKKAKLVFSRVPEEKPIRYTLPVDNKPSNNKEWADLVEQHKNK